MAAFFPRAKERGDTLSQDYKRELAYLLHLIESENALNSLDLNSWDVFKTQAHLNMRGRQTFTGLLKPLYAVVHKLQSERIDEAGFFSATFDYWKGVQHDDFLGIVLHCCSKDWKLIRYVSDLVYTPGRKYAVNVKIQVESCLSSHAKSEHVIHVANITDTASNVMAASEQMGADTAGCHQHICALVINDVFNGTERVNATASKAKSLIDFIADCGEYIRCDKETKKLFEDLQSESYDGKSFGDLQSCPCTSHFKFRGPSSVVTGA